MEVKTPTPWDEGKDTGGQLGGGRDSDKGRGRPGRKVRVKPALLIVPTSQSPTPRAALPALDMSRYPLLPSDAPDKCSDPPAGNVP